MRSLTALFIASVCAVATAFMSTGSQATGITNTIPTDFSCSGPVHNEAISLWEHGLRNYFADQIKDGLTVKGDVYVLYYTQEDLQPFVEMTRRCKDHVQIAELVAVLSPALDSLKSLPESPASKGWICTGGSTCTAANHLLGHEVQLCSAQFLGLLGAVATDIVETIPENQRSSTEKAFVSDAGSTIADQINRWLSPDYFKWVADRLKMTPASVVDSQSKYFFADRDLWFMTSLADLAELHQAGIRLDTAGTNSFNSLQSKRQQIAGMFDLFLTRTTLTNTSNGIRAEVDRGFWRNYSDSKYALYNTAASPVACNKDSTGHMQKSIRVESKSSYIDANVGWDISHARRLVPALETFVRNRTALATIFGYHNTAFDPAKLQQAYAHQIADTIWNKDSQYPLFSNFWDGSNGWYRSGYNNGTGSCTTGDAPYGLAWSFPTGGYPQWGAFNNTIRDLGMRIFILSNSDDPKAKAFMAKNYPQILPSTSTTNQIWRLAMISSLVDTTI
ncbi:hypothetical protein [Rhodanobacter sp. DHB23]|uniref:hypothetical protein n=1 Tax=Rhodanobacter sp. DHB23 TaxID=2775923 RepID=UPI00178320E8|nr:hypothetical protein [Rhodanobacter sp. DHB23]MBD8872855.1 hypothetical protein [Rhodanobacter sp. DHB23]